jgi:hypothetical protein
VLAVDEIEKFFHDFTIGIGHQDHTQ